MKTKLEITKEEALKLYPDASKELKSIFESTFGMDTFKPKKITDRINTLHDVWEILGISCVILPFPREKNAEEKSMNAQFLLFRIAEAYNEGWVPDWNNNTQYKYYPYFYKNSAGRWVVGASLSFAILGCHCPSGLCYKSSELAKDAMEKFRSIYEDYLMVS